MPQPFRRWLKREIENRLMTVGEFADRAGVPRCTMDTWLIGRHRPRGINIVRIAMALGVSREEVEAHLDPMEAHNAA